MTLVHTDGIKLTWDRDRSFRAWVSWRHLSDDITDTSDIHALGSWFNLTFLEGMMVWRRLTFGSSQRALDVILT